MTAGTDPLVVALLVLVVAVAVTVALARDLLVVTVVFGAYSLGLAILWVVFRAPDVGLTEAAVGAGVTASLFLAAVSRTGVDRPGPAFDVRVSPRSLAVGALTAGALLLTVPALPAVGDPGAPPFAADATADYYLSNAGDLGVDNVVTAVLVAFRGFDTFGEIAVVFGAGVAVLVVLRKEVP